MPCQAVLSAACEFGPSGAARTCPLPALGPDPPLDQSLILGEPVPQSWGDCREGNNRIKGLPGA